MALIELKSNLNKFVSGKLTTGRYLKNRKSNLVHVNDELNYILFNEKNYAKVRKNITSQHFGVIKNMISVYKKGDFYNFHHDQPVIRNRTSKIAYTVWLNDPKEYEGGELIIKHSFGETSFKEKAGTAIFYPPEYLHKVNEITKGSRKVLIGWLDCFISSEQDRKLLVDLEKSLSSLHEFCYRKAENEDEVEELYDVILKLNSARSYLIRKLYK